MIIIYRIISTYPDSTVIFIVVLSEVPRVCHSQVVTPALDPLCGICCRLDTLVRFACNNTSHEALHTWQYA